MPATVPSADVKPTKPVAPSTHQPIRKPHHRLSRATPFIHPAGRFRATHDPSHLSSYLSHLSFYPRRHIPQDFAPRHVSDRALRQYIAGCLRGRRLLENREVRGAAGRKRAILAGIKSDVKHGELEVTAAAIDRKRSKSLSRRKKLKLKWARLLLECRRGRLGRLLTKQHYILQRSSNWRMLS